ncbi:hypothetical protein F4677DRAFT_450092 [Hypoxylon crocopeplum]|nr:hypothetical protein F4677DRAFT_450092 [Hypoxylon crocopeplum]
MGSYVSVVECQTNYNVTLNCDVEGMNTAIIDGQNVTLPPFTSIGGYSRGQFPGDPDIAGIGILGVFVAVTSFAISAGLVSVLWQMAKTYRWKTTYTKEQRAERGDRTSFSDILETLVLACSDQQVFTGAAYALTLRYWRGCTISAYHYNIVANMMLLTCATHLMSVTIVRNYWKFPWLAILRVLCITCVFIVTGLLMTNQNADTGKLFPTGIPLANETDSSLFLPAACFESAENTAVDTFKHVTSNPQTFFMNNLAKSTPGNQIQGWNLYIITLLFYGAAIIAELVRFIRRGKNRPGWRAQVGKQIGRVCGVGSFLRKIMKNVFLFYLFAGVGLSCAVTIISTQYIFGLRGWVNNSKWIQLENGQNPENDAKSFGQLVPIFSSALIVFSFAQLISEKCTRRNNRKHGGEEGGLQGGNIPYLDPSSYNMVPSAVPEKDQTGYFGGIGISTASLPPQIGLEYQSSWGSDMNLTNSQVATPLLSGDTYCSPYATPGAQPAHNTGSHTALPVQPASSSPPLVPLPSRQQGQSQDTMSPISSHNSSPPQPRSLMGSPNVSQQFASRPVGPRRYSTRPF